MATCAAKKTASRPELQLLPPPEPHERPQFVAVLATILAGFEHAPDLDPAVRRRLLRCLYRYAFLGLDGPGHVTLLLRTIIESEGNGPAALTDAVVGAVGSCCSVDRWTSRGLEFIEAFDRIPLLQILENMRGLDIFEEKSIGHYLAIAIKNRVSRILDVPKAAEAKKATAELAPPRSVTRVPEIERNIALGLELLALRSKHSSNRDFGRDRARRYPGIDAVTAAQSVRVARLYGDRPEIWRRLAWHALVQLASPAVPEALRRDLEARVIGGEVITGVEIKRARGRARPGAPRRRDAAPPLRMAA